MEDFDEMLSDFPDDDAPKFPLADTCIIRGDRKAPQMVMVTNTAEHSPRRDAALLEVILSTSLPQETLVLLAGFLYNRHLLQPVRPKKKRDNSDPEQE